MASKAERTVINAAGLAQGIVLVTFPAASTIFTDTSEYGLSSTQYGAMFLPQVALAIATSLLGAGLARRISTKRVYLLGLTCSIVAMVLLLASTLVKSDQAAAYPMLLVATAFLGAGFGLTVPVLNTYTSVFHPDSVDRSVLTLNALLGLGTALAPVLVAIFVGLGFWWGLPIVSTVLLAGLLLVSLRLPLRAGAGASARAPGRSGIPARFWLYAAFAVCYGICEKAPKWQQHVDSMSPWFAMGLAPVVQPWALIAAGAATVTAARLSSPVSYLVLALFCILASASYLGIEGYAGFRPGTSQAFLAKLGTWVETHTDQLIIWGGLILGFWLIGKSIYLIAD